MSPLHWPVEAWLAAGVCVTVLTIALKEDRREQRERREIRDEWASFEMAGAEIIPLAVRRRYREIREPYDQLRPLASGIHVRRVPPRFPDTKRGRTAGTVGRSTGTLGGPDGRTR